MLGFGIQPDLKLFQPFPGNKRPAGCVPDTVFIPIGPIQHSPDGHPCPDPLKGHPCPPMRRIRKITATCAETYGNPTLRIRNAARGAVRPSGIPATIHMRNVPTAEPAGTAEPTGSAVPNAERSPPAGTAPFAAANAITNGHPNPYPDRRNALPAVPTNGCYRR